MWHEYNYHFFDYKYDIPGYNGQDFNGAGRWVYLIFTLVSIAILLFLFRNAKKKNVDIYVKVIAIIMPILEATKITWESINDISHGKGFNWCGLLPIYTCSLFIYTMLLAAFTKGKVKDYCLAWVTTIGLAGGMSNVIFIQGLKWYPFWTFGAFYSMFFHYIMVFTALFIVVTKYKVFCWKDMFKAMCVHLLFSIIVIPIDYVYHWDYMQYYEAGGIPVVEGWSSKLAEKGLRFLTVPIMLGFYMALAALFTELYYLFGKFVKKET